MKALIALVVLAIIVTVIGFRFTNSSKIAESKPIGIAAGKVNNGLCKLDLVVSMGMARGEGPRVKGGVADWNEWIAEHFILTDNTGKRVEMKRANFSDLISDKDAMTPDSFLTAMIQPNVGYVLDYKPLRDDPLRYRFEVTVQNDGRPFAREFFEPVME